MIILFFLQSLLFIPFYENQRTRQTDGFIDEVTLLIAHGDNLNQLNRIAYSNNVCMIIFNKQGKTVYSADNIGDGCVLNQYDYPITENLESLRSDEKLMIREIKINQQTDQTSLVVAKKVKENLLTYYIFVNTPIIPIASTITILQNLLIIASLIVIGIAFVISWYFSRGIANPIVNIKRSADQLALGNYQEQFTSSGYSEVEDLATTLNLTAKRLSEIDKMRKELFANVSHDLKTPLTNIIVYSELLHEVSGENPQQREAHLNIIQDEANYINQLVEDMNLMSKEGKHDLKYTNFNISAALVHLIDLISQNNQNPLVRFESYIEEQIIVSADKTKILQVIRNFINNSMKYSGEKNNVIEINLRKRGGKAELEVIDRGIGISKEQIPYIWDRYYRGSSNFHRREGGSGLGLSIAKSILEQHQLIYGASSEPGKGTRFYFEMEIIDGNNR